MKLTLLLYNILAKKRATAAHMCKHTDAGERRHYGDEWFECVAEMKKMENDLRKDGYKFVCTNIKAVGEAYYSIYKIAATATAD